MEIIFEFLFELIIEGSIETLGGKKVPLVIRIIASVILIAVYGGITGICFYCGIRDKSPIIFLIGIFILLITIVLFYTIYKKRKR